MTVVDFRSGGYDDARGPHGRGQPDASFRSHEWDEDWDDAHRAVIADGVPLSDRDSVLGRVARLTHYLGALVSVVLMISLMIWGYQLVVRDVSGVPVIRAVEGEGRIAPDEPGGMLSDRSGFAVNDVAAGTERVPLERVAIAPAPTALSGQDVAMGELGVTAREAPVTDEVVEENTVPLVAMSDTEAARLARIEAEEEAAAAAAAGVPAVAPSEADAVSVAAAVTDVNGEPTTDTAITAALAEAGALPSVTTPTRPAPRPRVVAALAAPAAASPPAAMVEAPLLAEAAPVEAPRVASGSPLVQIGAFDSDAIAQSEWGRVSGRYGDLFAGKAPVVQQHKAGGRTFYRLRIAGFETRDEARRFCAALIAAGTDCIPAAAQ
ncbi:SPOR domain-containing protein [Paracoccus sp. MC1854]|uniref:SPOR domain-containing protein n=1 Tax=Paracoccus sp. MC1854 TaxID=2760306 RepID=UPI001601E133|nr:SPOR domain-containing protein [Paracoccus sp. MC1854]MBB1491357.1 SPOR domain-containing protein [Paracoccus sp. MC1854]